MNATTSAEPRATLDWGRTHYADARLRQEHLVAQRIAGEIGDTLVFTEHEPVFTVGLRRGAAAHLVWDATRLAREGVEVASTNRGGDITYHGPGQVVGYPIVALIARPDLHAYLRFLEQVLINALGTLSLAAARREGMTGIWLGSRKVAALGVAVRRWVTYHGFALNVNIDLAPYAGKPLPDPIPLKIEFPTSDHRIPSAGRAQEETMIRCAGESGSKCERIFARFVPGSNCRLPSGTRSHSGAGFILGLRDYRVNRR